MYWKVGAGAGNCVVFGYGRGVGGAAFVDQYCFGSASKIKYVVIHAGALDWCRTVD